MQKTHVSVRCDPDLAVRFGLAARDRGVTASDLLRTSMERTVREHLNDDDPAGEPGRAKEPRVEAAAHAT